MGKGAQVGPGRKGMRRRWKILIGVFLALAVAFAILHIPVAPVTIQVGPETTRLTGPLNPDGTVNYFEAVRLRLSDGVTPENNAAPYFLKLCGTSMLRSSAAAPTLARLGLTLDDISEDNVIAWDTFAPSLRARQSGPDL